MPNLIIAHNATDAWVQAVRLVHRQGNLEHPRGMATKELTNVTVCIQNPVLNMIDHPAKQMPHIFSIAEMVWILSGSNRVDFIEWFNSGYLHFSDDGLTLSGAYGPKVVEQIPYVLDTLRRDRDSRQAVLTIWRERPAASKDIPCTIALQFMIRGGNLLMTTTMRSNDLFWGSPSDWYLFTTIQRMLAAQLGIGVGHYTHQVGSLHFYERHFEEALEVANSRTPEAVVPTPYLAFPIPRVAHLVLADPLRAAELDLTTELPGWQRVLSPLVGRFDPGDTFHNVVRRGLIPKRTKEMMTTDG